MEDPSTTFPEVVKAVRRLLPGTVARRRLFFRYTLRWDNPVRIEGIRPAVARDL
jgi:hypothetical protein